jgi:hypothetical protein
LADDIVYYAPEFDLFLPGDTGSSRAVGPPRWGILVAHILPRSHGEDGPSCGGTLPPAAQRGDSPLTTHPWVIFFFF